MAPTYKLSYFNLKALGEPIRFILHYGGAQFEDNRVERESWPKLKPSTPFGKMPLLEIDGKEIHQSVAICRHLARKFKLVGDGEWDALQADIVVDTINDFKTPISELFRLGMIGADEETKAKKKESIISEVLPYYLPKFEEIVKNNKGYFVNGKLTWADIYWTCMCDSMLSTIGDDCLKDYPHLRGISEKVLALPAIKAWVDKRPKTMV